MKITDKIKRLPKRLKIVTASLLALAVVALAGYWFMSNRTTDFSAGGVRFSYPVAYDDLTFTSAPDTLARLKLSDPESVITLAVEKNADTGAKMTHANFLDNLEANANKSLPNSYKGYAEDQASRTKVGGFDAATRFFHYTGSDTKSTVYVNLAIIPRGSDAYYLTVESTKKSVADDSFNKVKSSLKLP
jgi:hypothetical protein